MLLYLTDRNHWPVCLPLFLVRYAGAHLDAVLNSTHRTETRTVKALLMGLGTTLRSVNEPITDDPVGKLMANMLVAIGQFDNDAKSERTKAGMKAAAELGRWPFKRPLGT